MLKDAAGGCGIVGIVIVIGLVIILLTFAVNALNLVTLPWQENLKREGYEHSKPFIDGQVAILTTQMAEWNRWEAKTQADPTNVALRTACKTAQAGIISQMWLAYDQIPNDTRNTQVPLDVQLFLSRHPRGSF